MKEFYDNTAVYILNSTLSIDNESLVWLKVDILDRKGMVFLTLTVAVDQPFKKERVSFKNNDHEQQH